MRCFSTFLLCVAVTLTVLAAGCNTGCKAFRFACTLSDPQVV
jgi:hypothetical protein